MMRWLVVISRWDSGGSPCHRCMNVCVCMGECKTWVVKHFGWSTMTRKALYKYRTITHPKSLRWLAWMTAALWYSPHWTVTSKIPVSLYPHPAAFMSYLIHKECHLHSVITELENNTSIKMLIVDFNSVQYPFPNETENLTLWAWVPHKSNTKSMVKHWNSKLETKY